MDLLEVKEEGRTESEVTLRLTIKQRQKNPLPPVSFTQVPAITFTLNAHPHHLHDLYFRGPNFAILKKAFYDPSGKKIIGYVYTFVHENVKYEEKDGVEKPLPSFPVTGTGNYNSPNIKIKDARDALPPAEPIPPPHRPPSTPTDTTVYHYLAIDGDLKYTVNQAAFDRICTYILLKKN